MYRTIHDDGTRRYDDPLDDDPLVAFCMAEPLTSAQHSRLNISELAHYGASEVQAGNADILRFRVFGNEVEYVHESMKEYPDIMYFVEAPWQDATYGGPWPADKVDELLAQLPMAKYHVS